MSEDIARWDEELYEGEAMRLRILEQVRVVDLSDWVEPLE